MVWRFAALSCALVLSLACIVPFDFATSLLLYCNLVVRIVVVAAIVVVVVFCCCFCCCCGQTQFLCIVNTLASDVVWRSLRVPLVGPLFGLPKPNRAVAQLLDKACSRSVQFWVCMSFARWWNSFQDQSLWLRRLGSHSQMCVPLHQAMAALWKLDQGYAYN